MNIYLVVEGPIGEKKVYAHWVPLVNPNLRLVNSLNEISNNNLLIISGGGYPNYFEVIDNAIDDVTENPHIDRLVVAVDSEEMSYSDKRDEIIRHISSQGPSINYRVIVQHFCLETWGLGNQVIVSRRPKDHQLREYRQLFDVLTDDPELLPGHPSENLNRSQFAARYLKKLLNDKYRNLTYSKSNPIALLNDKYYERVKSRLHNTGHIPSFNDFLTAFV
jgi:hypothetical protein